MFVIIWLLLSLGHPNVYSLLAGFAHAVLYISILSPAFWASEAVNGTSHLKRVIALLFMCNALAPHWWAWDKCFTPIASTRR